MKLIQLDPSKFLTQTSLLSRRRAAAAAFAIAPGAKNPRRPDAAVHRHLCAARHRDHQRLQAGGRRARRQARRTRDRIFHRRRRSPNRQRRPENTNKLVQRDKVDVLVGTVH